MLDNFEQNFIGTLRVFNEKPIITELIGHGKFMSVKLEIESHSDYAVCDKFGYLNLVEFFGVFVEIVEKHDFGQINKMPRAVGHFHFK